MVFSCWTNTTEAPDGWVGGVGCPVNLKMIYLLPALLVPSGVIAGELGGLGGWGCGQGEWSRE